MENDVNLQLIIRDEFKLGSEKEETFKKICKHRGLNLHSYSKICNWFDRMLSGDYELEDEVGELHYNLLRLINGSYLKCSNAIFHYGNLKYDEEAFLNDRFLFVARNIEFSFGIFDLFNNQSKELQATIDKSEGFSVYSPVATDEDHILINALVGRVEHIWLLKVDFLGSECSIISDLEIHFICSKIILDTDDKTKFILYGENFGADLLIYRGGIVNKQIYISKQRIIFDMELHYCKLKDDSIFAFQLEQNENGTDRWKFIEYKLSQNSCQIINEWNCYACPNCSWYNEDTHKYVWLGSMLYTSCSRYNKFSIAVFDSNNRTWSKMKTIGLGHVQTLLINEDGILTVSAKEYYRGLPETKTVYRLPMRKPDKLKYIAWSTIRRGALFFESSLYKKLMPKLPYNSEFRLFSDY